MAANPIPGPDNSPEVLLSNAATATTLNVIPGQEIEWQNNTLFTIHISVQAVNGVFPFALNNFPVPGKQNQTIGTHSSVVLPTTPAADYPFTRTGQTPMGSGKVVVKTGK